MTDDTMSYVDLEFVVGAAALREFDAVFGEWLNECNHKPDPFETARIMFAAGYVARRNDELLDKDA